jgi:hypothetical protein
MTFSRTDPHEVLVKQIQEALTALGWCVEPTGQGQFSATMQENLHNCWLPATLPLAAGFTRHAPTPRLFHRRQILRNVASNHALEQNALAAALNWTAIWEMDVWYIFTDGSGIPARQLAKPSVKWPGPHCGNGSGTPFWLFPVGLTTPWEQLPFTNPPSKPNLCPSPDLDPQRPANFCLRRPTPN